MDGHVSNIERRFVGKWMPLDEHGRGEARLWAARMAHETVAGIYSSPLSRARETAQQLGEPKILASLQELDQGVFEESDWMNWNPRLPFSRPGEPIQQTLSFPAEKAWANVETEPSRDSWCLNDHQPGPPVVVVTHQMVMASVVLTAVASSALSSLVKHGNTAMALFGWCAGADSSRALE